MNKYFNRRKNGYTLYELVVTIAIFAIASVAVISFIVYVNTFMQSTKREQQNLITQTTIVKYTDLWFSYYDNADYQITVQNSLQASVYALSNSGETYGIIVEKGDENSLIITFQFPQNSPYKNIRAVCPNVNNFLVYKFPQSETSNYQNVFSFNVSTHIQGDLYRVDLIYN